MKRIPADIEQLIWLIAESGDSSAAQEFEHRFPEYKFELNRRMSTVKSLKSSKPTSVNGIPVFQPVLRRPQASPMHRFGIVAVSGLVLMSLAFGSYALTKRLWSKPPPPPAVSVPQVQVKPFEGTNGTNQPDFMKPTIPDTGAVTEGTGSKQQTFADNGKRVLQPYQKPNSVSIEGAPLHDVIQLIGSTCGFQVKLLPGLENPTVSAKYDNLSGEEMLIQLGKQYGFTPSYQGNNEFYIIPAIAFSDPVGR